MLVQQVDLTKVKPYGDTLNDGMTQLSFTLPVPFGEEGKEAARQLVAKMGLTEPSVVNMQDLGDGYTYFIVYGKCQHSVDYTSIVVPKVEGDVMEKEEVEEYIEKILEEMWLSLVHVQEPMPIR